MMMGDANLQRRLLIGSCICAVAVLTFATGRTNSQESAGSLAIVVHPDVDVEDLSMEKLRQICLAEQQYWPDRSRIVLLIHAPAASERTAVLRQIYKMTEDEFRRYWIAKIFRAEIPSGPKVVLSSNMARELVSVIPNSITFMRAGDVGSGFKIVRVDGKLPGEVGYPLTL